MLSSKKPEDALFDRLLKLKKPKDNKWPQEMEVTDSDIMDLMEYSLEADIYDHSVELYVEVSKHKQYFENKYKSMQVLGLLP